MQWLIDITIEAMEQYLVDNPRYVERGDVLVQDFDTGGMIKNDQWHDWDLSGIIDEGAVAVLFAASLRATAAAKYIYFRQKGYAGFYNVSVIYSQVALVYLFADMVLGIGPDRKLEYLASTLGIADGEFTIKGWWL